MALVGIKNHDRASLNVQKVEAAQRMCTAARDCVDPDCMLNDMHIKSRPRTIHSK